MVTNTFPIQQLIASIPSPSLYNTSKPSLYNKEAQMLCVCSTSRNNVSRVAQRYGNIAAHTRRHASVLVVFIVFCVHMHSFAGLIRRTPSLRFSDTAITDRHSDTTIFQLRSHRVRISWSIGSEKSFCRHGSFYPT